MRRYNLTMPRQAHCNVEVRIINPSATVAALFTGLHRTWFVPDAEDLVFRSWLHDTGDVNKHLKWLYAMLQHDRKLIRRLDAEGARWMVRISCDHLPVTIMPESLLLAHKLHLPIEIVSEK
jgi:hypothetical protein